MPLRNGLYILLAAMILISLTSCKEKNELYPPLSWDSYFYGNEHVDARPISALLIESDHSEWFGSRNDGGLVHNNGYAWLEYNDANTGILFDSITSIVRDGNGFLWVAWRSGLAYYDGYVWHNIDDLQGLCISSLAVQGIGIIWIGISGDQQSGGIARWENGNLTTYTSENSGIPSSRVLAIAIDHDQHIWIGTRDQGIIVYDGLSWDSPDLSNSGVIPASINALIVDQDGNTWAGTDASQLIIYKEGLFTVLNTGTSSAITALLIDTEGSTWIGTRGQGVIKLKDGTWESYTAENAHLPGNSILALCQHPNGRILASYDDGHIISFKK